MEETSCEQIYIVISTSTPCQTKPCMTLNEYAANASKYDHTNMTTLILTQGHHTLDVELSISNITDISISSQELDNVTITCIYPGRLVIVNVNHLFISMLRFEHCDNNEILSVDEFLIEDSVFTHGTSATLVLNEASGEIRNVNISDTSMSQQTQRGAIYCNHSSVVINETVFERNIATDGGAVFMDSQNNVTIIDSIFLSNSATRGGALFAKNDNDIALQSCKFMFNGFTGTGKGGAIVLHQSLLTVVNCSFKENRASAGAVIFSQYQSEINISNSFFIGNKANVSGGVLYGEGSNSFTVTVEFSEFDSNIASQSGGIFFLREYNSSLEQSNALTGRAIKTKLEGSIFVTNSMFQNNQASQGSILNAETSYDIEISNSSFLSNTSPVGGVVYAAGGSTVSVASSDFRNNGMAMNGQGTSQGGVISITQSSITVTDSTFMGNTAKEGGAFNFMQVAAALISNNHFSNNFGQEAGGVLFDINSTIDIRHCEIVDNGAQNHGGALLLNSSFIELTSNEFYSNRATVSSGAVYLLSGTIIDINNSYSKNTAYYGGAHFVWYSIMEIQFSSFTGNLANDSGGAIFTFSNINTTITNSAFVNNTSGSLGGAVIIYSINSPTNKSVTLTEFKNNQASSGGALCLVDIFFIDLSGNMFYDNFAFGVGGGIYSSNSNISLSESYFENNSAIVAGGAIVTFGMD